MQTATPESVGISSADIAAMEAAYRKMNCGHQGYMLYRHGKLVASSIALPYRMTDKRHVYSVSKSFTSTAIGIAVGEGLLSVDDRLISFFPELLPETVSDNLAAMTVRNVLSMNTGHQTDTMGRVTIDAGWAKRFLSLDVENVPGTHFAYNSTATYMLSAIITKVTGMRMVDYLRTRLFEPLDMHGIWWEESPEGISDGGWGIHVSPEDMLKLGILYLNGGVWNNRRILPADYLAEAISPVSDNSKNGNPDWRVGYGFKWWRCQYNCFRADGAYGQFIIVSPDTDSVAVIISETNDLQGVLNVYWDTVLTKMSDTPLPESAVTYDLAAKPVQCPPIHDGSAVLPREYTVADNSVFASYVRLIPSADRLILRIGGNREHSVEFICGLSEWIYNQIPHCPIAPTRFLSFLAVGIPAEVAASYGCDGGKLTVSLRFVTTPHGLILVFDGNTLTVTHTIDNKPETVSLL